MRRQRNADGATNALNPTKAAKNITTKLKKKKKTKGKKLVAAAKEEEGKRIDGSGGPVAEGESLGCGGWEWKGCGGSVVVDEQMSWGWSWLPCWDVEYMVEQSYNEMFSDVVWDDDIWNLKSINQIPN